MACVDQGGNGAGEMFDILSVLRMVVVLERCLMACIDWADVGTREMFNGLCGSGWRGNWTSC